MVKNPLASAGDTRDVGLIPGLGRFAGRRKWQPPPVFLPGEFQGQRSMVGYSPWGLKESNTTEQLSTRREYGKRLVLCAESTRPRVQSY